MLIRGRDPLRRHKLVASARSRRALVYVLAAALVVAAALGGVRLASPPDPHARVRVQRLPGAPSDGGRTTTEVTHDLKTNRTAIDVRQPDGTVTRYYVDESEGQWQVEAAPETSR